MEEAKYVLGDGVFECLCGNQHVLLDLRSGKYLALDALKSRMLRGLVSGWPELQVNGNDGPPDASAARDLAALLHSRGLVVRATSVRQRVPPDPIPSASAAVIVDEDFVSRFRIRRDHWSNFIVSWAYSRIALKRKQIGQIVGGTRLRRIGNPERPRRTDDALLEELIVAFAHLRPFLYSANNACLLDSFVLIEFLARYRFFPKWVFGVRAQPFEAHCWVQLDTLVLNDSVEHVGSFTPIMAA